MATFPILPTAPKIYSEQFRIRSYHTDIHRKLTIPKLCSFFQEVAGNHTVACGVGWEVMQEQRLFWVLSRLKIEVIKYPVWQQKIEIRSWSNGTDGLFAYRNFLILDEDGNELIRAISMWLMVNTATRRLTRPDDYMNDFPLCEERLFDVEPEKIGALNDAAFTGNQKVAYTETDMNAHMNNACYIERILNAFDPDYLLHHEIASIDMNFLKEAVLGDELKVASSKISSEEFLNAVIFENGKEAVKVKSVWRKI